ncbi:MAG: hypothetical protein FJ387_07690 [Verrucomicrobia bacterium]|nr:hypothetical protein [Verrucomicrobiota bacterium]
MGLTVAIEQQESILRQLENGFIHSIAHGVEDELNATRRPTAHGTFLEPAILDRPHHIELESRRKEGRRQPAQLDYHQRRAVCADFHGPFALIVVFPRPHDQAPVLGVAARAGCGRSISTRRRFGSREKPEQAQDLDP